MLTNPVKEYFAIHDVVVLTKFSKSMLDYLARENIFRPSSAKSSGKGIHRRYSYADVVLLRALHAICVGSGRIRNLKAALVAFRREVGPLPPGRELSAHLLVQGNKLCMATENGPVELVSRQYTLPLVVDLPGISREIAKSIRVDPHSPKHFTLAPKIALKAETERVRIWGKIKENRERKT